MFNFCVLLSVLFIGLKLSNIIFWSWVWVLSPLWLPVVLVGAFYLYCLILFYIANSGEDDYGRR